MAVGNLNIEVSGAAVARVQAAAHVQQAKTAFSLGWGIRIEAVFHAKAECTVGNVGGEANFPALG